MAKLQFGVHDTRGILSRTESIDITDTEALVLHGIFARYDTSDAKPNDGVFEVDETLNASVKLFGFKIPIQDTAEFSVGVTE